MPPMLPEYIAPRRPAEAKLKLESDYSSRAIRYSWQCLVSRVGTHAVLQHSGRAPSVLLERQSESERDSTWLPRRRAWRTASVAVRWRHISRWCRSLCFTDAQVRLLLCFLCTPIYSFTGRELGTPVWQVFQSSSFQPLGTPPLIFF
jgi:hypothetical protein